MVDVVGLREAVATLRRVGVHKVVLSVDEVDELLDLIARRRGDLKRGFDEWAALTDQPDAP